MGILKNLKTWLECIRTGRMSDYKRYKQSIAFKQSDIKRFEGYIEDATMRVNNLRARGYSDESKEMKSALEELQRWRYTLDEKKLELEFTRPNSDEDIHYRNNNTGSKFVEELKKAKSDELNLVFHGTPIYFAREILRTGKISSSADRYDGYIKSTDMLGEISVSDIDSLSRTLDFFSGMASYQHCLPAGCIFAMFPKDDKDFSKKDSIMSSVDFKQNPEQLYGIFTTPENIPMVQKWLEKAGLDPNLAHDFEGFLHEVKKTSRGLDGDKKLDSSVRVSQDVIQQVEERSHSSVMQTPKQEEILEKDDKAK